jgi:ribosomal-protein-alanine N-acetyltransferase
MIRFREAVLADIDNIMALERACFNRDTQESENTYLERIGAFPQGFIVMETADRSNFSSRSGTEFLGAVSSELWKYKPSLSGDSFALGHSIRKQLELAGDELYISSIGIFPEYRKCGYGKLLFRELIKRVQVSFPLVVKGILLINEEWKDAGKIYANNGFYDAAVFEDFFTSDNGEKTNGIVMRNDDITIDGGKSRFP